MRPSRRTASFSSRHFERLMALIPPRISFIADIGAMPCIRPICFEITLDARAPPPLQRALRRRRGDFAFKHASHHAGKRADQRHARRNIIIPLGASFQASLRHVYYFSAECRPAAGLSNDERRAARSCHSYGILRRVMS